MRMGGGVKGMKKEKYKPPIVEDLTLVKGADVPCGPGDSPDFSGCGNGPTPIEWGGCDIGGAPIL